VDTFGHLRQGAFQMSFEHGLTAGVVCTNGASSGSSHNPV
jgi:hypothetical protein